MRFIDLFRITSPYIYLSIWQCEVPRSSLFNEWVSRIIILIYEGMIPTSNAWCRVGGSLHMLMWQFIVLKIRTRLRTSQIALEALGEVEHRSRMVNINVKCACLYRIIKGILGYKMEKWTSWQYGNVNTKSFAIYLLLHFLHNHTLSYIYPLQHDVVLY